MFLFNQYQTVCIVLLSYGCRYIKRLSQLHRHSIVSTPTPRTYCLLSLNFPAANHSQTEADAAQKSFEAKSLPAASAFQVHSDISKRLLLLKLLLVRSLLVAFLILPCLTLDYYHLALPAHSHLLQLSDFLGAWFLTQFLSSLSYEFYCNQQASVKKTKVYVPKSLYSIYSNV